MPYSKYLDWLRKDNYYFVRMKEILNLPEEKKTIIINSTKWTEK
jgi:hypothetical protein